MHTGSRGNAFFRRGASRSKARCSQSCFCRSSSQGSSGSLITVRFQPHGVTILASSTIRLRALADSPRPRLRSRSVASTAMHVSPSSLPPRSVLARSSRSSSSVCSSAGAAGSSALRNSIAVPVQAARALAPGARRCPESARMLAP